MYFGATYEQISTLTRLKNLEFCVGTFSFEAVNNLQQLRKLKLNFCDIATVSKISLPQLCELNLQKITTSFSDLNIIFQEVCGTLKHLIIHKLRIEDPATLNISFTALESFEIVTWDFDRENKFLDELLESIAGSAKTLKRLKCDYLNYEAKNFNIGLFKNLENLSFLQPIGNVQL
jgi:hypothetical protein